MEKGVAALWSFPFCVLEVMDFLDKTVDFLESLASFDVDRAWIEAVDTEVQDLIIHLITKKQLGNDGEGIDGDGFDLGEYTAFTVAVRSELGLQTDHVSFEQTGQYLESVGVVITTNGWEILKDEDRFQELTAELGFSDQHMKLTKEHEKIVFELIRKNHEEYVNRTL